MAGKSKIGERIAAVQKNPSLWWGVAVIVALVLSFIIVTQSIAIIQLRYQIANLNDGMVDYKNNNKVLTEKIDQITADNNIEALAREKLGMVKPGEAPIKINEKKIAEEKPAAVPSQEKVGIYMKDWYQKMEEWVQHLKNK